MKFRTAVVIGKFYPPHRGHKFLIDTALNQSQQVTVIVCAKPTDGLSGELRGRWLQEIHPTANVMVINDRYDENDTAVWAKNTVGWLQAVPEAVFTSENYGEPYARAMGSVHVAVDPDRKHVPCSATMIRENPFANWEFIEPPVRAWFAFRVCVLGAESTGTTTLAQMLAEHYRTTWVPEYGREYPVAKLERGETDWTTSEFIHIAEEQNRQEEMAARQANRILIADTNSFATCLWHRRYMDFDSDAVRAIADRCRCDLYLLTGDEIPFVQDGLRDGQHIRHKMHHWFEAELLQQQVPWKLLRGSCEVRLADAIRVIDDMVSRLKRV